jgi:amino acid transporter
MMNELLDFVIFYFLLWPLYAPLAAHSFDSNVIKFQASDRTITDFMNSLYPPISWLFFSKMRRINEVIYSKNNNFAYLEFVQKQIDPSVGRLLALVISCLPTIIAFRGIQAAQSAERIGVLLLFIPVSVITVMGCFRLGHNLGKLEQNNSPS